MDSPRRSWLFLILLSLTFPAFSQTLQDQELVIGGFSSIAPWVQVKRTEGQPDEVTGGIIKDIADLVARKTGVTFRFYFPPRRRMELEVQARKLHVLPMADPAWLQNPAVLNWSGTVISDKKIFVTPEASRLKVQGPQDLKNLRLALQSGFVYPELPENLGYLRDDADTVVRNLTKMDLGRVDAVYAGEVDLGHRLMDRSGKYVIQPWSPGTDNYRWAVAKTSGEAGLRVIKAVEELVADGSVAKILSTYR